MNNVFTDVVNQQFQRGSSGGFWGSNYQLLNSLKKKSDRDIFNYQLSRARSFLDVKSGDLMPANDLFKEALKETKLLEEFYKTEVPNTILKTIMDAYNAIYYKSEFTTKTDKGGYYLKDEDFARAIQRVTDELEKSKIKYGFAYVSINKITDLMHQLKKGKKKGGIVRGEYTQRKAAEAEQLTADVLNSSTTFRDYHAFVTGQLEHNKQLLQDVMMVRKEDLTKSFKNGGLTYSIKGKGNFTVNNIQELLDGMEQHAKSGDTHHIILSDPLHEELVKASQLSVQTKSGIEQKIINKNTQRQITLNALFVNNDTQPAKALQLLYNIALISKRNNINYFKDPIDSPEIQSWANYILGKDIIKLLHFEKDKVHLLFTDNGFETPYAWMKRTEMVLKFDKTIDRLDTSFPHVKRYYNLRKIGKD